MRNTRSTPLAAMIFALLLPSALVWQGCGRDGTNPINGVPDNGPPTISFLVMEPDPVLRGGDATMTVSAVDKQGDSITIAASAEHGEVIFRSSADHDGTVSWTATYSHDGQSNAETDTITVTATDNLGYAAQDTFEISVAGPPPTPTPTPPPLNHPPTVTISGEGATCHPLPNQPCSVYFTAEASDPDGDPLIYSWRGCARSDHASAPCSISNMERHTADVTVIDGRGGEARASSWAAGTNQSPRYTGESSPYIRWSGVYRYYTYTYNFADSDGDALSCSFYDQGGSSSACGFWSTDCSGGQAQVTYRRGLLGVVRDCKFSVGATDPWGDGASHGTVTVHLN